MLDELPMTALVDARAMLLATRTDAPLQLRFLVPPYPALGCGVLRALRVREVGGVLELVAGYDAYERLGA
jgi:hypothetical protein